MAARPPKPPDNNPPSRMVKPTSPGVTTRNQQDSSQNRCQQNDKSDCSCTNISIIQLFYEMKQIFPTVPDNVVNQCVIENCHDRENCIKLLNNELAAHPTTAQSYPSQAIRSGVVGISGSGGSVNQNLNPNKKPLVPARPAPTPRPKTGGTQHPIPKTIKSTVNNLKQEIGNKIASVLNCNSVNSDMRSAAITISDNQKPNVPKRPTTLNLRDSTAHGITRTLSRPTRAAPPPPPPSSAASGFKQTPPPSVSVQNASSDLNQSFNSSSASVASVQSPMSFSDSGESEISVNISLSPSSSDRSRAGVAPTRCITTISVQPEPAYTRAVSSDSGPPTPHRSYTSLNLTLRKPSDTPQSPIDITAGSVLKYSSTRYDAINGCEQNFHITVTDGGGSITSARIRPRSCHCDPDNSPNPPEQSHLLRSGVSMPNVATQHTTPVSESHTIIGDDPQESSQDEIVRRQQSRKSKLVNEVKNKRQLLEEMDKEVKILKSSISPNECVRLDREIEILRCDCERLLQDIERNGKTNVPFERVYENIYAGQQSGTVNAEAMPRQRPPPIPAALSRLRSRPGPPSTPPPQASPYDVTTSQNPYLHSDPLLSSYPTATSLPNRSYGDADYANANYIDDNGPPWTCSMCTFQNYPLLNKCEGCDNVRIIPGTVQIFPSSSTSQFGLLLSSTANTSAAASPVVATHTSPLPSNSVVNNSRINNNSNSNNHQHLSRISAPTHGNSPSPNDDTDSGPTPNMHQLIAYPTMVNSFNPPNVNFMIPQ